MKYLAVILVMTSICFGRSYQGPLGLKWGDTESAVDSILSKKCVLQDSIFEDSNTVKTNVYEGEFAGYTNAEIQVSFFKGKLEGVAIEIPQQGEENISKTWEESVALFQKKHGNPTKQNKIPPTPSELAKKITKNYPNTKNKQAISELLEASSDAITRHDYLDIKISAKDWEPKATWEFDNALVLITAKATSQSEEGEGMMKVIWAFLSKKLTKQIQKSIEAEENRKSIDF